MVMLVENQPMPSAGTMPRDRHGTYHVSMTTPPPAVAAQPFSHQWDINDSTLPLPEKFDKFQAWPHGHCRYIYNPQQEDGRRHVSGWAMRNTNNHNALILKKSCLGVLVCSQDCLLENGEKVHLRPAICDKARRKQIGKPCPNPKCSGSLELMACRGHCGYPVTHFWRHAHGAIYFQAKGYHDHPRPEVKSVAESRRGMTGARHYKSFMVSDVFGTDRKRQRDSEPEDATGRKLFAALPGDEVLCSCPPFECTCNKSRPGYKSLLPPYDMLKDSLPPPPSFTQINITNNYPPPTGGSSLDLFLRGSNTGVPPRQGYGMMDNPRLLGPAVSVGQGAASGSPVNARAAAGGEASAFDVPSCRQRVPTHPDSSMCAATLGHGSGLGDGRPRAATPLAHRPELPPGRFLCEQQVSESEPLLLGDRLLSGGSTSHFLSPSTEALFGGPSRMEELCTVPPGVKTEPQDTHSAFRPDSRPLAATDSSASTSAMGDPAMDMSRHLTPPAGCAGETMFSGGSGGGGGGVGGLGPSSLPHLLASRSPDSVLDVPDSDAAFTAMTSPAHGHAQVATPTLQDKRFEELRPVQHKLFPGQQGPRTAFDVLHNPVFFRDDMHHPGFSSSSASTLSSLSRPRENTLAGNFFGQQEAIAAPHAPMPMRSDAPVTQHPGVSEVGSPWYGRCPSDCFQRAPQGSQPCPGMYKQACNHSINITLTYN